MDPDTIADLRSRLQAAIARDTEFMESLMDGDVRLAAGAAGRDVAGELGYTGTGLEMAWRAMHELDDNPAGRTPPAWEAIVDRLSARQHTYTDDIRCRLRACIVRDEATMERLATVEAMWSAMDDRVDDQCYAASIAEQRVRRADWLLSYINRYPPRSGSDRWWRCELDDLAA